MRSTTNIEASIRKTESFIEKQDYRGFDPYDGLSSPIFKAPFLNSNKKIRFLSQQLIKRSPVNLRSILFIKQGYNPVTLGLCIQAYVNLSQAYPKKKDSYEAKIHALINQLQTLVPTGFNGVCWGYDFDWEARYSRIPAYQPTIVATGIITNALYKYWSFSKNKEVENMILSAAKFALKDLNRTTDKDGDFCFSYSPFDHQVVFNASMKGVRLLAQAYHISKDEQLKLISKKACTFIMKHQNLNGSWIYSKNRSGEWIDNYHTGYVIDCLHDYIEFTGDTSFKEHLKKGFSFYRASFFHDDRIPKFYNKNIYPIDCTAAGQSLLTLSGFNDLGTAENVCNWMIENMQSADGSFYFRKYKNFTNRTKFMRWSNAWMFAGMSELLNKKLHQN